MNEQHTYFKLSTQGTIRLLQITDPHLFSSYEDTLLNVKTIESFSAVIEQISQQIAETGEKFDLVLATGDLIQDNHLSGYHHFAVISETLETPIAWLEGNHDVQPAMSEILGEYPHILPHKQILAGEHWQILLLNTQVVGKPHGELADSQLAWLAEKLRQFPNRFALIVQHHNILPTNSAWLDQHKLRNAETLAQVLSPFPRVKAIVHGHIHQQVDAVWNGISIFATPSTCIQFKPNCDQFTLDLLPQGWREIYLHENGEIETVVKRLDTNNFLPNFAAEGY